MSATVMGFDVSNVPTADLMEFAAKLLRLDAQTLAKFYEQVGRSTDAVTHNVVIAGLLDQRAKAVRALEMMAVSTEWRS